MSTAQKELLAGGRTKSLIHWKHWGLSIEHPISENTELLKLFALVVWECLIFVQATPEQLSGLNNQIFVGRRWLGNATQWLVSIWLSDACPCEVLICWSVELAWAVSSMGQTVRKGAKMTMMMLFTTKKLQNWNKNIYIVWSKVMLDVKHACDCEHQLFIWNQVPDPNTVHSSHLIEGSITV